MKTIKTTVSVLTVMATTVAMVGCQGSESSSTEDSTLSVNYAGFPESWAPGAEMEPGYQRVPYENLVALNSEGEVSPVLATDWEQTDTELTLTLREDVTFHDGTPFNAEAVKTNLEFVRDGDGPYSGPLQVIETIEAVDEHTVRLALTEPTPSLLTTLSTRSAPMASPTAIEEGTVTENPVGTGPWAFDSEASTQNTRTFQQFDDYWGGSDSVDFATIELNAIEDSNTAVGALSSGELDILSVEPQALERVEGSAGIESLSYPAIRNNVVFFDRGPGGVFEDADVRRAACYAINTDALPDATADITPSDQHFAEGEPGYNPDVNSYSQDLDRAEELLEEAGNPDLSVEAMAAPFTESQLQIYASQLSEAGIEMDVQVAPPPQFFSEWSSGQFPMGMGSHDELTPYDWYKAWFAADAPGNPAGVESDELAEAAEAAIDAGTSEEADELWAEVTGIIADEALACAHATSEETIAWSSERVQGVEAPTQPWEPNLINYTELSPAEE